MNQNLKLTDDLIARLDKIAHLGTSMAVTVRAADLRTVLAKLREGGEPVAGEWVFQVLDNEAAKLDAQLRPSGAVVRDIAARLRAALASTPVAGEALGWRVRERRSNDGKLLDCFVEAPAVPGMAYAQEVLGDDYAEAQGGIEGKLKHCQMFVAWANAAPQAREPGDGSARYKGKHPALAAPYGDTAAGIRDVVLPPLPEPRTPWALYTPATVEQYARAAVLADRQPRAAPVAGEAQHPDDAAVDRFALAMKAKLAKKRADGRGGWQDRTECRAEFLSELLRGHVEKGDPLDVGNLAMMLHQRGERITSAAPQASAGPELLVSQVMDLGEGIAAAEDIDAIKAWLASSGFDADQQSTLLWRLRGLPLPGTAWPTAERESAAWFIEFNSKTMRDADRYAAVMWASSNPDRYAKWMATAQNELGAFGHDRMRATIDIAVRLRNESERTPAAD